MKNRLLYILILILLTLCFPIFYEYFRSWPASGVLGSVLMLFGLALSGPLLILYSLLVHLFADVKGKKVLSTISLLVGLAWATYMAYTMSNGVD